MLSETERRAASANPTAVMEAYERELLTLVSSELANLQTFSADEIEARRVAVALKTREIKQRYDKAYKQALREAYRVAFLLNAVNEL